jgi:glycosyltransferase involved in cell wall biosynthesis
MGGTRQYLCDVLSATKGMKLDQGIAYATERADDGFRAFLTEARAAGWDTFSVPMTREVKPRIDALAVIALRRVIRQFRPDVLHCHSSKAGAIGRLARLFSGLRPRVLYAPHALARPLNGAYMTAERILAPLADAFVAVSESERAEIVTTGLATAERVLVVSPVIDIERLIPRDRDMARRELGLGEDPLLVAVGRMTAQKDPVTFVRALAAVRARVPRVRGLWVGDGELRWDTEATAAEQGVSAHFNITGWQVDVRPYLAAADLVCSTSRYESFGYATAEALAMERPVIATRVTGTIDVVGRNAEALLFVPTDSAGAADRAVPLLRDRDRAKTIAREGREDVLNRFSTARMAAALEEVYGAYASAGSLGAREGATPAVATAIGGT